MDEQLVVFAGGYANVDDAKSDFDAIKLMHKEAWIGPYEGALFTRQADGKIKVLDTDSSIRATGATAGAVVGGLMGLIFPPSLIVGAAIGGAVGAFGGHLVSNVRKADIEEMGVLLEEGQAGIFMVGIPTPELGTERLMKHAAKVMKKAVDADADALKKAIDEAAKA